MSSPSKAAIEDSEDISTFRGNRSDITMIFYRLKLPLACCSGKNSYHDERKRSSDIPGLPGSIVLYIYAITIGFSFIAGFVVAFQPLQYSNHLSLLDTGRVLMSHTLKNDLRVPTRKCVPTFVHVSDQEDVQPIEHSGIAILTKDDDLTNGPSEVKNTTNRDLDNVQYPPPKNSQQPSFSFKDQIQQCKASVNIVDVIETYQLEEFHRTGSDRAMAICPFHDDHHPSLHIDATKQIYKCFSCNAGGDVIHFVQEYSKLPLNNAPKDSELSFIQALQHIQQKFGDGTIIPFSKSSSDSNRTPQESMEVMRKKERILLANTYAALYFTNCLKELYAGGARHYLRSVRGLSSPLIKTMMIGYAPDTYYDYRFSSNKGNNGPSSLVNHLLQSGFTSHEILDSGLAVMRKNQTSTQVKIDTNSTEKIYDTSMEDAIGKDSTMLMDRFRGRIMVPIIDEIGNNVLGFGGRILPPLDSNEIVTPTSSSFKAAKYLNSPESIVFEKRKILFNQHLASKAIHTRGKPLPMSPLILVEGYMDVISLFEIGIYNVAATMGTAISTEQLDQASKAAGCRGGKIVLCLDNDNAGTAAVERLCRNGMLEECTKKNVVSIHVSRLPNDVKDPADFIEARRKTDRSAQQILADFINEVVETAVDWTDWYVQTLISGYDREAPRGSAGSFSDVFERIADFLATSLKPAERTKVAFEVAGRLSSVLAKDRNSSEISLSVRIQLESDLIDLASRLATEKEILQRRIDAASTDLSNTMSQSSASVASFTSGLGPNSMNQEGRLSKNATSTKIEKPSTKRENRDGNNSNASKQNSGALPQRKVQRIRATMSRSREPNFVSVTTHFSGFLFQHQSDMDWLGLKDGKGKKRKPSTLVLGQYQHTPSKESEDTTTPSEKQIYFNSASFNGYQFLTDTAISAGYATNSFKPDASLIENGLASIVEQDSRKMIESAENKLLKLLVNDCAARSVVKNMLTARQAVNFGGDIHWSTSEKRWLFELLVYGVDGIDGTCSIDANRDELRYSLAQHPSAPLGAFSPVLEDTIAHQATVVPSEVELTKNVKTDRSEALIALAPMDEKVADRSLSVNTKSPIGTLEIFFEDESIPNEDCAHNEDVESTRNELAVQETLVTLLLASTSLKSKIIRAELVSYSNSFSANEIIHDEKKEGIKILNDHKLFPEFTDALTSHLNSEGEGESQIRNITSSASTSYKFDKYQSELLTQLRDTTRTLQTLKESSNRIALRLLDESSSTGVEGSISQALQMDLASRLDDHVRDVLQNDLYPEPGINDLPYEMELETMAEEWGDWYDDDYVWIPGESSKLATTSLIAGSQFDSMESDVERETLDEFFERVDREWSGWDD